MSAVSPGERVAVRRVVTPVERVAVRRAFLVGERVVVRRAWQPGHVRTPAYIRGRVGRIERCLGAFPNPEELAYRRSGAPAPLLYRVRFLQADVWPDYRGPAADAIEVEIYHHWLEPAEPEPPHDGA